MIRKFSDGEKKNLIIYYPFSVIRAPQVSESMPNGVSLGDLY